MDDCPRLELELEGPAPQPPAPDEPAPWDTVLLALGRIAGVDLVAGWPVRTQPQGRAAAVQTPVTFRPFDAPGKAAATTLKELSLSLATAITSTVAALTDRPAIEPFVPHRQRYGERSVVVRAAGMPVVVSGGWIKSRGVYALIVEVAYVQHVVTAGESAIVPIAAHN